MAGGDAAVQRQQGGRVRVQVGMAHRVAVHRRVGLRRQVDRRQHIRRQHPPGGRAQAHRLGRCDAGVQRRDARLRLLQRQQRAAEGEAVVAQLRHGRFVNLWFLLGRRRAAW